MVAPNDVLVQAKDICFDDNWFSEIDFEKQNIRDENDEESPF